VGNFGGTSSKYFGSMYVCMCFEYLDFFFIIFQVTFENRLEINFGKLYI